MNDVMLWWDKMWTPSPRPCSNEAAARMAGRWLTLKARRQAFAVGTFQAARNLRKQGVPLDVALAVLVGRTA